MKQSWRMSLVESITNVVVGYLLAIATQIAVFPWFGIEIGLAENMTIGLAFTGASLVRGYLLRRLFEAIRIRMTEPSLKTSGGSVPVRLLYRRDFGDASATGQPSIRSTLPH